MEGNLLMSEIIKFMAAPFVACLAIVSIHAYLGIHVLKREIIFVDLALAQIAALGTTVGFILGVHPENNWSYLFSFGFVLFGAAIFSLTRMREQRIPQEAIIGITYAVATAAAILVADRAPGGAEHIKEILTGAILWVNWPTILRIIVVYLIIGGFHYLFRDKFLLISENYQKAVEQKIAIGWWDFLFYITFGIVIVLSVRIAGILLVFSFLVVPAAISSLFSNSWGTKLIIGWIAGMLGSVLGLYVSYTYDFPSGPAIVCFLGLFLILAGMFKKALTVKTG